MRILFVAALGLGALTACENTPSEEDSARPPAPERNTAAGDSEPTASPDVGSCVENCIRDNQMRAEPIEEIRRDCRNACN